MDRPNIQSLIISPTETLIEALKKMDEVFTKLLLVCEGDKFISVLSIGDIQRKLLTNYDFNTLVKDALRKDIKIGTTKDQIETLKDQMIHYRIELMPIIDENSKIVKLLFWDDLFDDKKQLRKKIDAPVVIMAGGEGNRLKPITNIIPKPLIPIVDKSIIETIIDSFTKYEINEFIISVNYKAGMIKKHLEEQLSDNICVRYIKEPSPLGTIGSLYLLKNKISKSFFVTNCDIFIDQNYSELYDFHTSNKHLITIVTATKCHKIPYGTIKLDESNSFAEIIEKPEYNHLINTGMYILNPKVLELIPDNEFFHITQLIEKVKANNGSIGIFPISEQSWMDIGEWSEYYKTQDLFKKRYFNAND